jgi:Protein of unknown function (DUF1566)
VRLRAAPVGRIPLGRVPGARGGPSSRRSFLPNSRKTLAVEATRAVSRPEDGDGPPFIWGMSDNWARARKPLSLRTGSGHGPWGRSPRPGPGAVRRRHKKGLLLSYFWATGPRQRSACRSLRVLWAAALLASVGTAHGSVTAEQKCQAGRANAAAKYASCAETALAKFNLSDGIVFEPNPYGRRMGRCVTKYAGAWPKLRAKASGSGSTCDNPRFTANGDGTLTDNLTGLVWEKKTNLDGTTNLLDPHDADNYYTWTAEGLGSTTADGTAFTNFLAALNGGSCFAGQCDWRLASKNELLTIGSPAYPHCLTPLCIDPAFGPTTAGSYWSATTNPNSPDSAWVVSDFSELVFFAKDDSNLVRAVRGGL